MSRRCDWKRVDGRSTLRLESLLGAALLVLMPRRHEPPKVKISAPFASAQASVAVYAKRSTPEDLHPVLGKQPW